jgi:hypothetical protein
MSDFRSPHGNEATMNPLGFALAGAVLLTTSLAAFDTLGQSRPLVQVEIGRSEQQPAPATAVQVPATRVATVDGPRRPVRVILSSPYDRRS